MERSVGHWVKGFLLLKFLIIALYVFGIAWEELLIVKTLKKARDGSQAGKKGLLLFFMPLGRVDKNPVFKNLINQSVLIVNSTGPAIRQMIF